MYVNFPSFQKKQRNNISSKKNFWNLIKTKMAVLGTFLAQKNVVGFFNTNYLIGYNWYAKIMKWNPHVPKTPSFLFYLSKERSLITLKSKSAQSPRHLLAYIQFQVTVGPKSILVKSKQTTVIRSQVFRNLGSSVWAKWQTFLSFYSQNILTYAIPQIEYQIIIWGTLS